MVECYCLSNKWWQLFPPKPKEHGFLFTTIEEIANSSAFRFQKLHTSGLWFQNLRPRPAFSGLVGKASSIAYCVSSVKGIAFLNDFYHSNHDKKDLLNAPEEAFAIINHQQYSEGLGLNLESNDFRAVSTAMNPGSGNQIQLYVRGEGWLL